MAGPDPDPVAGPGRLALAWFTGSPRDGVAGMTLAAVRYGVNTTRPAAFLDIPTGLVVVVSALRDRIEVSPRPQVDADGSVRRPFRPVPALDGVATVVEDYAVVADDVAPERMTPLRYRVLRDGERLIGTIDVDLGPERPAPELTPDRLRPGTRPQPGDAAATAEMREILTRTGLAPRQVSFTVLWAGNLPHPARRRA